MPPPDDRYSDNRRRFRREGRPARAGFSALTGVLFLAGFAGIASGSVTPVMNLSFTAAVILVWAWIGATSAFCE